MELKKQASKIDPIMRIGKNGITDNIIEDIKNHLKKRGIIKIKFLKSYISENDKKVASELIVSKTNSNLVELRGFNLVISKKDMR